MIEMNARLICDRCNETICDMNDVADIAEVWQRLKDTDWGGESEDGEDVCWKCWAKWDAEHPGESRQAENDDAQEFADTLVPVHAEAEGAQAVQDTWQAQAERGDAQFKELLTRHAALTAEVERLKQNHWTCFHCGETFTTLGGASDHFGATPESKAGCLIARVPLETGTTTQVGRGLLMALRTAEALTADLREALRVISGEMQQRCGRQSSMYPRREQLLDWLLDWMKRITVLTSLPSSEKSEGQ